MRTSNNDDDTTIHTNITSDEDPSVLWERLQQSQRQQVDELNEEIAALQNEKQMMESMFSSSLSDDDDDASDNDIIELNAGGTIITTLRSTLTVASGTNFSCMFNGRWKDSLIRDDQCRVFLDHDAELITIIVNFLRSKKIQDKSKPALLPPNIPDDRKEEFEMILHHYGLFDLFYPRLSLLSIGGSNSDKSTTTDGIEAQTEIPSVTNTIDVASIDTVEKPTGTSVVDVTKSEHKIELTHRGSEDGHHFVACTSPLDGSGDGSFWKVTVNKITNSNGWVLLGIVGNLNVTSNSYSDAASYAWAGGNTVWISGSNRRGHSGWTHFTTGECLYFHFKSNKLTMYSVQKNQKYTMDVATPSKDDGVYYMHFNLYSPDTKITLEPLIDEVERALLL